MAKWAVSRGWQIAFGLLPIPMGYKTKREISLSKNLHKLISSQNLSLSQISRKLGINKSTLHNYCNGVEPRGLATIQLLADYFEISVSELIYNEKVDCITLRLIGQVEGQFKVDVERIK